MALSLALAALTSAPKVIKFVRNLKSKGAINSVMELAESLTGQEGESAIQAINQSPELALKFEQAVMEHKEAIVALDLEETRAYLADIQAARDRDVKIKQTGYHNYRADVMLSLAFTSLVIIIVLINGNDQIKPEVLAIFNMAVGALLKMIGDGFSFEFGSSRGSKEKDRP